MKKVETFLVTGANGDIGDAIGRTLVEVYPGVPCFGADCAGVWPGRYLFQDMFPLPPASSPEYMEALSQLSEKLGNTILIAASEPEIIRIASDRTSFGSLAPLNIDHSIVTLFSDKLTTNKWLRKNNFPAPYTVKLAEATEVNLPLVVKPQTGSGSKGIHIVKDIPHLKFLQSTLEIDAYIAQEYIDVTDNEFTCAVFRNKKEVRVLAMKRRLQGGFSNYIFVDSRKLLTEFLADIADKMDLSGAVNVQLRVKGNTPYVFEVNPRFSSTVRMRHLLGFSDLIWSVEDFVGNSIAPYKEVPHGSEVYRMSREVVVSK
ncbi:ATP-grasp domain-containing protein [Thalassospira lucentensis]|uniref:ATP-grasp domain-containing protein n=1 Tax=Thalassospira lucentensis TaxID=168935 RepID=UPI003D2E1C1B